MAYIFANRLRPLLRFLFVLKSYGHVYDTPLPPQNACMTTSCRSLCRPLRSLFSKPYTLLMHHLCMYSLDELQNSTATVQHALFSYHTCKTRLMS